MLNQILEPVPKLRTCHTPVTKYLRFPAFAHFLICINAHFTFSNLHICPHLHSWNAYLLISHVLISAKLPKTSFAQFHVILIPFLHLWGVFGLPEFLSSAPAFPSAAAENFCICVCHCLCLPFFFFICV